MAETQTEARKRIVDSLVAKWDPSYALVGQHSTTVDDQRFTIVDMQSAIDEAIKTAQGIVADAGDALANTVWSADNRGRNGSPAKVREQARSTVEAITKLTGSYRS